MGVQKYLNARALVFDHTLTKVIALSDSRFYEIMERSQVALNQGILLADLESVAIRNLNVSKYIDCRLDFMSPLSHSDAVEVVSGNIWSYSTLIGYGFSHVEIVAYCKESVADSEAFEKFCLGRRSGFSVAQSQLLAMDPSFPSDVLQGLVELEIPIDELVIAAGLDGSSMIINNRMNYAAVRVDAAKMDVQVSHVQAVQVAVNAQLSITKYLELRKSSISHEKIIAMYPVPHQRSTSKTLSR